MWTQDRLTSSSSEERTDADIGYIVVALSGHSGASLGKTKNS